jgi:hypothetical protein
MGIPLVSETSPGHLASAVMDGADQAQVRSSALEPVMATGVDLQQHAFPGIAVTPATMFGRSATTRRGDAGGEEDAANGWPRKSNAMVGQHLSQVLVIEGLVLVCGQLDLSGSDRSLDGVVSRSAPVAVRQAGRPFLGVSLVKALELSLGDSQKLGCRGVDQRPTGQVVKDDDSALLSCVQDDPAIHGVTESLYSDKKC